jgi:hypothetical protein
MRRYNADICNANFHVPYRQIAELSKWHVVDNHITDIYMRDFILLIMIPPDFPIAAGISVRIRLCWVMFGLQIYYSTIWKCGLLK